MKPSSLLLSIILLLSFFSVLPAKKKIKIHTWKTEAWQEFDYFGAGYHVTWDKIKPNIWVRVKRMDGEVEGLVGIPNNVMAGHAADWSLTYDPLNLYSRINFSQDVATVDADSGDCSGGGRCYGDWVNNVEVWDGGADANKYKDKNGLSFLTLQFPDQGSSDPHGAARTRFRFDVFVEDNTPYWLRDPDYTQGSSESTAYDDWDDPATPAEPHYPFKRVIFRVTNSTSPSSDDDRQPADIYYTDRDSSNPQFADIFMINNEDINPIEQRVRWGKHVYSFTEFFQFPSEGSFFMEVTAIDMEDNRRTLRIPIDIGRLGGLNLQDKSNEGSRQ